MAMRHTFIRLLFCGLLFVSNTDVFANSNNFRASYDEEKKVVAVVNTLDEHGHSFPKSVKSVYLQSATKTDLKGIYTSFEAKQERLMIRPVLPLLPDIYVLRIETNNGVQKQLTFEVVASSKEHIHPSATHIGPSTTIPANALRLYIYFNEPMARGQVKEFISLRTQYGQKDQFAFLNLLTELWGPQQRRLTLLFDPGRVKQDVGPNLAIGSPLVANHTYQLVIANGMMSAHGLPTKDDLVFPIEVVGAEKRKVSLSDWIVVAPEKQTQEPLLVKFTRLVDPYNAQRNIDITGTDGEPIVGKLIVNTDSFTFLPVEPWSLGEHTIVVDNDFEDVAGNRLNASFDSIRGRLKNDPEHQLLKFTIE